MINLRFTWVALASVVFSSCMNNDIPTTEFDLFGSRGVFIVNEGNYLYGNSSLSYYDIESKEVINDIFSNANGIPLGDVAYSMTIRDGKGYIVVNNSGCIHIIDLNTVELLGTITKLTSPRFINFISSNKAYVSDLYARGLTVINPENKSTISHISTGKKSLPYFRHSSEEMIILGNKLYTNSWSFDNNILVIDIDKEILVDSIEVGIQPLSMVLDKNNKIWVINDGGYQGNPIGYENPSIMRVNPHTRTVEEIYVLPLNSMIGKLAITADLDSILYISNNIFKMDINATALPVNPIISRTNNTFRSIAIDKITGDIYAADAVDYFSEGKIFRFKSNGEPIDTFSVGITPTYFCFN